MGKQPYDYEVVRQLKSATVPMGKPTTYSKAFESYMHSPQAFGIQRLVKGSSVTAGLLQPTVPHRIKVKGSTYERGYVGHHTKHTATALARGFKTQGHKAVLRKIKGGWHVFVKFDQRRL